MEEEDFGFTNDIYQLFFQMNFDWPCLSFDIIRDEFGAQRTDFPHKCFFVSASQADANSNDNRMYVTHISDLQCTKKDEELEELIDPQITCCASAFPLCTNRIRSMIQNPMVVATFAESSVLIWDITASFDLSKIHSKETDSTVDLIFEIQRDEEGFGLTWSPHDAGILVAGDGTGTTLMLQQDGGSFSVIAEYKAHSASVEDICFSPKDNTVFATCSGDGYVSVWDSRDLKTPVMSFLGRYSEDNEDDPKNNIIDVNVISWNAIQTNLIATGSDNGQICVFDMRETSGPDAYFNYHEDPITSIEWNPNDESEVAASCEDGRVTVWDLSVEALDEKEREYGIPDQLMFEHGIEDPKEIHYHPQIKSLIAVTGAESFDVFIPDIVEDDGE